MIRKLRDYLSRQKTLLRNPTLRMGRHTITNESAFEEHVALGDDAMVLRSEVGRYTYFGPRCIVADAQIGRFCSIAADVSIGTGGHPLGKNAAMHPIFYLSRPPIWNLVQADQFTEFAHTKIGSDVWIGTKAVIRDGVTVGHGCVIGAGAVVTKDTEPYGIYVGVPAKLTRFRFPQETRDKLLKLQWWDKDFDWIKSKSEFFQDVDRLIGISEAP